MVTNSRVESLVQGAHQRMVEGRMDDAAKLWGQVQRIVPSHPQALFYLGRHYLYRNDLPAALELLKRASNAAPQNPAVQLNLSYVFQRTGDVRSQSEALDRALAIDPNFFPAILSKGELLERQGFRKSAARAFDEALLLIPENKALPTDLAKQVQTAREIVARNAEELEAYLSKCLKPIEAKHSSADLRRFSNCKDAMIGTKRIYNCKPTLLNFPELPAVQFYDNSKFPWLPIIEEKTEAIRGELASLLLESRSEFRPYVDRPESVPNRQWVELNRSKRWSAYFLWEDGEKNHDHCDRCPNTAAALEAVPLCDVAGFAPTAFFSILEPHSSIPAHHGVTNTRLIVHLALEVPESCSFRVGNETRQWQFGKAFVFDDTIEHQARNDSDELRAVLIFDVWNPGLTIAEREHVSVLLDAFRKYYAEA